MLRETEYLNGKETMSIHKVNLDELFPKKDNSKSGAIYEKHTPQPFEKKEKAVRNGRGKTISNEALLLREQLSQLKKTGDIVYLSDYSLKIGRKTGKGDFCVDPADAKQKLRDDLFIRSQCKALGFQVSIKMVRSKHGLTPRVTRK